MSLFNKSLKIGRRVATISFSYKEGRDEFCGFWVLALGLSEGQEKPSKKLRKNMGANNVLV